ncbi:MAG: RagB/SusD family nutrient uptake outer membrane protein [Bacteroidetes bacterium]|nr:RagB/SusD family nutrient uptake outer membrane protein [Bacteroidota bacterium]
MKRDHIGYWALAIATTALTMTGCKKNFLDEFNPSNRTTDNYYNTASGYNGLVISCYPLLRDITQQRVITLNGTDMFSNGGWSGTLFFPSQTTQSGSNFDTYDVGLNSSSGEVQRLWDLLYRNINRCNAAVERAGAVQGMADSVKNTLVAEARFLRALCYFWAVQQWGDIPMPLKETTTSSLEVKKTPQKNVYTQIITDLEWAVPKLPNVQTANGRVTRGAARFLLARVYLTRGWNFQNALGGTPTDFTVALGHCDALIASNLYPLETNWNNLWPIHNKNPKRETATAASSVAVANASREVVFSIQYSNPNAYNGDGNMSTSTGLIGNNMHAMFSGGPNGVAQEARTSTYNRFLPSHNVTWGAYRLFDPVMDVRYEGTFNSVTFATVNGSVSLANNKPYPQARTLSFVVNDTTAVVLPWNVPMNDVTKLGQNIPGGTKKYAVQNVVNLFWMGKLTPTQQVIDPMGWGGPMFWKFWQPGIAYGDGFSTFNDPIFRSAELFLMAAEAIVKGATGAQLGSAAVYYNRVLDRALGSNAGRSPMRATNPGKVLDPLNAITSYRATPSNINIDMILDEYGREFLGEGNERWYQLKRTGKLVERALAFNGWTAWGRAGTPQISANKHLVRPLPQGMLDNTNPRIEQNAGY